VYEASGVMVFGGGAHHVCGMMGSVRVFVFVC
jgi:hypothetical protein